jgi:spore germination cell wall hydrolase CwlJ-like protein
MKKLYRIPQIILGIILKTLVGFSVLSLGVIPYSTSSTDVQTEYYSELSCLTELLFYEARNTGSNGMIQVAQVVKNRTNLKGFPQSYCGVSKQRFQFSFHQDKHKQKVNLSPQSLDTVAFTLAGTVARLTLEDRLVAPFGGSTVYYHTHEVKPSWARRMKVVMKDRFHVFYSSK